MRAARARRARAIAIGVVAFRSNGGGWPRAIPMRLLTDDAWRQQHLFRPIVRRAVRRSGIS